MASRKLKRHCTCKVRKLSGSLYECLTETASKCDKAMAVNLRYFCRHPDRGIIFKNNPQSEDRFPEIVMDMV